DALFRPATDASEMMRVRESYHADAVLASTFDPERHRSHPDRLSVAATTVEPEEDAGVQLHLGVLVRLQLAIEKGVHIARNHAHAMRIVPAQVRFDEVTSDEVGLVRRGASLRDDDF